jgi:2-polyprenyl-3-methyl-5-hydroxy-6-metoxy-1,4-benzoquinol methylase
MRSDQPWQLAMFSKGLKKNLRLKTLTKMLKGLNSDDKCLLVTCGDNNGAMNYHLRELGGSWAWADLEEDCIAEMSELLGEPVNFAAGEKLPFDDGVFQRVIAIDVHEHVEDPTNITRELCRVAKPGGNILITVPNGDEKKLAVRAKFALGMTPEAYGHTRIGFTKDEVERFMRDSDIEPVKSETYSRFFTEMLELTINFMYVKVLKKGGGDSSEHAEIAPTTEDKLKSVKKSYRIYALLFPFYWLISRLDFLLLGQEGYCVIVSGNKLRS